MKMTKENRSLAEKDGVLSRRTLKYEKEKMLTLIYEMIMGLMNAMPHGTNANINKNQ